MSSKFQLLFFRYPRIVVNGGVLKNHSSRVIRAYFEPTRKSYTVEFEILAFLGLVQPKAFVFTISS